MTNLQVILLLTGNQDVALVWLDHSISDLFELVEEAEKRSQQ
jgi:hypothetical protein